MLAATAANSLPRACVLCRRLASVVPFLRINKMKTAAIVRPSPTVSGIVGEICNGLDVLLREVGIEPTTFIYNYSTPLTNFSISDIQRVGDLVADQDFDVAICCGSSYEPSEILATEFKTKNWTPKIAFSATDNPWTTPNAEYWIVADSVRGG